MTNDHFWQRWSQRPNVRRQGLRIKKNKLEAQAIERLFEVKPSQGQEQKWSRPRTKDAIFLKNIIGRFSDIFKRESA